MERGEREEKRGFIRKLRDWSQVIAVCIIAITAIFLAIFFLTMFVNVNVGNSAILVDPWGKTVSEPILGPTWIVKWPWVSSINIYYAVDSLGMWGAGQDPYADYPAVPAFSKDQLEMQLDIMVRWSLDPDKIRDLYRNYPNIDWKDKVISSIIRQEVRFITKEYNAIETIEKRDLIAQIMQEHILQRLNAETSLAGAVTGLEFELRNIGLPSQYMASIQAKLVAEQDKIRAEFELQRTVILANATAQSKIIVAEGIQQAIQMIIESAGIEESETIAQLYLWAETIREIAPNIDILIITTGEDGIPLIYTIPPAG